MTVAFFLIQTRGCQTLKLIAPAGITLNVNSDSILFAVIGDYGKDGVSESAVARMVKKWQPDFILTTGDNNYDHGDYSTLTENIGKYYGDFIYNYDAPEEYKCLGRAFQDKINRFFPTPGNHDAEAWPKIEPYLNYFTLPGEEEYYTFTWGPAAFFTINSLPTADHDTQKLWLKRQLAETDKKFKIVYFHHPPHSTGSYGDTENMQWDFHKWGVDVVLSGHDHIYARMEMEGEDGLHYIVNGLGGASRYACNEEMLNPAILSHFCYDDSFGAMRFMITQDRLEMAFYSIIYPQTPIDQIEIVK